MRLIDADCAVDLLKSLGNRDYRRQNGTIQDAIKMLSHHNYTPTVDAVPVVRCRECKNYIQRGTKKVGACDILCCAVDDDFFCADGKRKEQEG